MLRKITISALAISLLATPALAESSIKVKVNGSEKHFSQPPAMVQGRLLVPLRGIFESLNAQVKYDAATRSIRATKGATQVDLTLGSRQAFVNSNSVVLDVPANVLNGSTMVPLRFVSEALGAQVKWEGAIKTVSISEGAMATPTGAYINNVVHNGGNQLKTGDRLTVVANGAPESKARFEIVGLVEAISMTETSPGRYEGSYRIPRGLKAKQAVVTVTLDKDGKSKMKSANAPLSINSDNSAQYNLFPMADSTIGELRPEIRATFPEDIATGTTYLSIDGVNKSSNLHVSNRTISWIPNYDMEIGVHKVKVAATNLRGVVLKHEWSFEVTGRTTSQGSLKSLKITPTNPSPGQNVQIVFEGPPQAKQAWLDFGKARKIKAQEISNGKYMANYVLQNSDSGMIDVKTYLELSNGQTIEKTYAKALLLGQTNIETLNLIPSNPSPGQNLQLVAKATPGSVVTFTVGDLGKDIPSTETESGNYVANFMIPANASGKHQIKVHLVRNGQKITKVLDRTLVFGLQEIAINQPLPNQAVGESFEIRGKATPNTELNILVEWVKNDLVSIAVNRKLNRKAVVTTDSQGNFSTILQIEKVTRGLPIDITITDGLGSAPKKLQVVGQ